MKKNILFNCKCNHNNYDSEKKENFIKYFEEKFEKTIREYELISKKEKVCVAVSGGKDSVVSLFLLKKLGFDVSGLVIDEGLGEYRLNTINFLKKFCEEHNIKLNIKSFKEETGKTMKEVANKDGSSCNTCGTIRRFMLNKYSQGFDKLVTGHNLDDESQAVLMNLFKAQISLFDRQGPITNKVKGFTQKIKPLYFIKEKEVAHYAVLKGFDVPFEECPYSRFSFRSKVKKFLNKEEKNNLCVKENIINNFLKIKKKNDKQIITDKCKKCGFPSDSDECNACKIISSFSH